MCGTENLTDIFSDTSNKSSGVTLWTNARLATFAEGSDGMGVVEHGAIAAKDGVIVFVGATSDLPEDLKAGAMIVDCGGR